MIHIVTDGTADMPLHWQKDYAIHVLPLRVQFGEDTFTQGENFSREDFYRMVAEKGIIPSTSLPSLQQLIEFYRNIPARGEPILSIHVGSKLSGTYSVVQLAAKELAGELDIHPFDSAAGSAALGFMCREARFMSNHGDTIQQVLQRMTEIRDTITIVFTIDRLDFARMSGRVNLAQSFLSSMLNIKPTVYLRDGLLVIGEKIRTRKNAIERVLSSVLEKWGHQKINLAVVHAAAPEAAQVLFEKARSTLNCCEAFVAELSIPVAAHLGPGAVGIVAYPVREEC